MAKKIYLGTSDFAEIIQQDGLLADKSLFIKEIIDSSDKVMLFTRPRRWGKTLNQSMLQVFLSLDVNNMKTSGLFDNLAIARISDGQYIKQHQGKYPVIFISFKDIKEKTFVATQEKFTILIQQLFMEHSYLMRSKILESYDKKIIDDYLTGKCSQSAIEVSLQRLSQYLKKHHGQKVYILIDEYDTPLNEAYLKGYINELTELMRNLFSSALKDNQNLQKGIMTGILRISKDSMLSGLNNLKVYTILDKKYSEYFGFTDDELDLLFKEQCLERNEEDVKQWYNGYNFGGRTIYNPWSILNCLSEEGVFGAYWVSTGSTTMIEMVLDNFQEKVADRIVSLMEGQEILEPIDKHVAFDVMLNDESTLWGLLLFSGHLTASVTSFNSENGFYNCDLRIPNKELMIIFNRHYNKWFKSQLGDNYAPFLKSLITGDVAIFSEYLNQYLLETMSSRDIGKTPENFYHGLVVGLIASLRDNYVIKSNHESGTGFYDVLIMPLESAKSGLGLILEFKVAKDTDDLDNLAKIALAQINSKHYDTELKTYPHINKILKLGLAFNKKSVKVIPSNYGP